MRELKNVPAHELLRESHVDTFNIIPSNSMPADLKKLFQQWVPSLYNYKFAERSNVKSQLHTLSTFLHKNTNMRFETLTSWFYDLSHNTICPELSESDVVFLLMNMNLIAAEFDKTLIMWMKNANLPNNDVHNLTDLLFFLTKRVFETSIVSECVDHLLSDEKKENQTPQEIIDDFKKNVCDLYIACASHDLTYEATHKGLTRILMKRLPADIVRKVDKMYELPEDVYREDSDDDSLRVGYPHCEEFEYDILYPSIAEIVSFIESLLNSEQKEKQDSKREVTEEENKKTEPEKQPTTQNDNYLIHINTHKPEDATTKNEKQVDLNTSSDVATYTYSSNYSNDSQDNKKNKGHVCDVSLCNILRIEDSFSTNKNMNKRKLAYKKDGSNIPLYEQMYIVTPTSEERTSTSKKIKWTNDPFTLSTNQEVTKNVHPNLDVKIHSTETKNIENNMESQNSEPNYFVVKIQKEEKKRNILEKEKEFFSNTTPNLKCTRKQANEDTWNFIPKYLQKNPINYMKHLIGKAAERVKSLVHHYTNEKSDIPKNNKHCTEEYAYLLSYAFCKGVLPVKKSPFSSNTQENMNQKKKNQKANAMNHTFEYKIHLMNYHLEKQQMDTTTEHADTQTNDSKETITQKQNKQEIWNTGKNTMFSFKKNPAQLQSFISQHLKRKTIQQIPCIEKYLEQIKEQVHVQNMEDIPYAVIATDELGEDRLGVNYASLNASMNKDVQENKDTNTYKTIPDELEIISKIRPNKYFSVLNISFDFLNVPLHEDSKKFTLFKVKKQNQNNDKEPEQDEYYVFNVIPFDLIKGNAFFQNIMECLFEKYIRSGCIQIHVDEIIIMTITDAYHIHMLQEVFKILYTAGFTINRKKSQFALHSFVFSGHKILKGHLRVPHLNSASLLYHHEEPPKEGTHFKWYINLLMKYSIYMISLRTVLEPLSQYHKYHCVSLMHPDVTKFNSQQSYEEFRDNMYYSVIRATPMCIPDPKCRYIVTIDLDNLNFFGTVTQNIKVDQTTAREQIMYITLPIYDQEVHFSFSYLKRLYALHAITKHIQSLICKKNASRKIYLLIRHFECADENCSDYTFDSELGFMIIPKKVGVLRPHLSPCLSESELLMIRPEIVAKFMKNLQQFNCVFYSEPEGYTLEGPCCSNWLYQQYKNYCLKNP